MARYCSLAVWHGDYQKFLDSIRTEGLRISTFTRLLRAWIGFHLVYDTLCVAEWTSDLTTTMVKLSAWLNGFRCRGVVPEEVAGLIPG